jgi:hypothetical protein
MERGAWSTESPTKGIGSKGQSAKGGEQGAWSREQGAWSTEQGA